MDLYRCMYLDDALWFIAYTKIFYMAICTPSNSDVEFILTDNSYNIFEGPNTCARNKDIGRLKDLAYTELHMFASVSPKLMIVLRFYLFPQPTEDRFENVRQERELYRRLVLERPFGGEVKGMLHDLPVAKAQNSYFRIVDGKSVASDNYDGTRKKQYRFFFSLFPIGVRYVNIINGVLLENCISCTSVVFGTTLIFAKTLEWFLRTDSVAKVIAGVLEADARAEALRKKEIVFRALGLTGTTIAGELPPLTPVADKMHQLFWAE